MVNERYKNLLEDERQKLVDYKRQYGREWYKNLLEAEKQRLVECILN